MKRKKVLLVGWDAADWHVINPLLDSGKMPALESIVNNGTIGNIATLDPPLSPMLWTSIATGKRADKHGILNFTEPDQQNGLRPVNVTSRKCHAIWNILNSKGYKCNVIGWWPSFPAEPINGVMVSNFFHKAEVRGKKSLHSGMAHPGEMIEILKEFKVDVGEITEAHILPFIPKAGLIDQEKDNGIEALVKMISEAATIQAVTTYLMMETEWDFTAVYFDTIDHFSHAFMKFYPPKMNGISDEMFEIYNGVIEGAYIFQDMMLERLLKIAGEDTTVILLSDHGFQSGNQRSLAIPKVPAGPAYEHRPYGIFCIKGENIKADERVYGATLLDITPTILNIYGLPCGEDMDGKILYGVFEKNEFIPAIPSWENEPGDFYRHDSTIEDDPIQSAEALKQLIELGYVEDPGEDKMKAMEMTITESKYNLSRVYSSSGNLIEAIKILEELNKQNPDDNRFAMELLHLNLGLHQIDAAEEVLKTIREKSEKDNPALDLFEGILLTYKNRPFLAMKFLQKAEASNPAFPTIHIEIGKIYLLTRRYPEAERAYLKAIDIDEDNAIAWHGLSIALLRQQKYEEAADSALNCIGLLYHFPQGHYHLGEALFYMRKYEQAAQAFEVSVLMMPKLLKARKWLVKIYSSYLNDPLKLKINMEIVKENERGEVIVVSGLPRSGTSLMMQMLKAGGLEILTDDKRLADNNNPKGYYEFEPVKNLMNDKSWLPDAEGKVVKVIAQLLPFLPNTFNYRVIYMQRDLAEIMRSQQKMLGRNPDEWPLAVAKSFEKEQDKTEAWYRKEPGVELLKVNFQDVFNNPEEISEMISGFLDIELDIKAMGACVEPDLYRNKV